MDNSYAIYAFSLEFKMPTPSNHKEWEEILSSTIESIKKLATIKGGEYAGDDDRLANFRRNALALGVKMETVWAIYYNKHHDSVMQYIQDLATGKERPRSEPMEGRVDDMLVYLLLFKMILAERNRTPLPTVQWLSDTSLPTCFLCKKPIAVTASTIRYDEGLAHAGCNFRTNV